MKSESITAVIRTLGRASLPDATASALREFENVIVVLDPNALPVEHVDGAEYFQVGRKWDQFNGTAINLAAAVAKTPYITLLDDDDEFVVGAGEFMQQAVAASPEIDIWIPALAYNDGLIVCEFPGMWGGNVAVPTYKTEVFWRVPFTAASVKYQGGLTDYFHVESCAEAGLTVSWYGRVLYLVRPKLPGRGGGGGV